MADDRLPPSEDGPQSDAQRFYSELHDMLPRYDGMTVYETIGALEAFKLDMLDRLARGRSVDGDADSERPA
jgi:hypothetical protein